MNSENELLCAGKKHGLLQGEAAGLDIDVQEIQEAIEKSDEKTEAKIDWTKAWGKKYPILLKYQDEVNVANYEHRIDKMLDEMRREYGFDEQDAMLVLKDILYNVWKRRKNGPGKK